MTFLYRSEPQRILANIVDWHQDRHLLSRHPLSCPHSCPSFSHPMCLAQASLSDEFFSAVDLPSICKAFPFVCWFGTRTFGQSVPIAVADAGACLQRLCEPLLSCTTVL
jgi:hypothetical protein